VRLLTMPPTAEEAGWRVHRAKGPPPILDLESVQILRLDVTDAFEDPSLQPLLATRRAPASLELDQ
jgi:hypothetical protein